MLAGNACWKCSLEMLAVLPLWVLLVTFIKELTFAAPEGSSLPQRVPRCPEGSSLSGRHFRLWHYRFWHKHFLNTRQMYVYMSLCPAESPFSSLLFAQRDRHIQPPETDRTLHSKVLEMTHNRSAMCSGEEAFDVLTAAETFLLCYWLVSTKTHQ